MQAVMGRRTAARPVHRPAAASLQALSIDENAVNTAADYLATNFRILKALAPAPLSGYIATTPEGIASQLTGAVAMFFYLTTPPNVLGGLFDYVGALSDKGGSTWTSADIGSKMGRPLGKGTYGTVSEAFLTEEGLKKLGAGRRASGAPKEPPHSQKSPIQERKETCKRE